MPAQFRFRRNVFRQNGNFPRVGAWTAPYIADIFLERLAFLDDRTGALHAAIFGGPDADMLFSPFALHHRDTMNSP